MLNCFHLILSFFVFSISFQILYNLFKLNCKTHIDDYEIINIFFIDYSVILYLIYASGIEFSKSNIFFKLSVLSVICIFCFLFFWNILGTFRFYYNFQEGNCLSYFQTFITLLSIIIVHIFYLTGFIILMCFLCDKNNKKKKYKKTINELLLFYKNPKSLKETKIKDFLKKYPLLEKKGMIKKEEELFLKYAQKEIENLKNKINEDNLCCDLCMIEFKENKKYYQLDCPHIFHKYCIINWYKIKPKCPKCGNLFRNCIMKKFQEDVSEIDIKIN